MADIGVPVVQEIRSLGGRTGDKSDPFDSQPEENNPRNDQLMLARDEIAALRRTLSESDARYDALIAGFDELLGRLRDHELDLATGRQAADETVGRLAASLADVEDRDRRLAEAEKRIETITAESAVAAETLIASLAAGEERQRQHAETEAFLQQAQAEGTDLQRRLAISLADVEERDRRLAETEKRIETISAASAVAAETLIASHAAGEERQRQHAETEALLQQAYAEGTDLQKRLAISLADVEERDRRLAETEKRIETISAASAIATESLIASQAAGEERQRQHAETEAVLQQAHAAVTDLEERLAASFATTKEANRQLADAEDGLRDAASALAETEMRIAVSTEGAHRQQKRADELADQIAFLERTVDEERQYGQTARSNAQNLFKANSEMERQFKLETERAKLLETALSEVQLAKERISIRYEQQSMRIEDADEQIVFLNATAEALRSKLDALHVRSSRESQRLAEANDEIHDLKQTNKTLAEENAEIGSQHSGLRLAMDKLRYLLAQTEVARTETAEEKTMLEMTLRERNDQVAEHERRLDALLAANVQLVAQTEKSIAEAKNEIHALERRALDEKHVLIKIQDGTAARARAEAEFLRSTIHELQERTVLLQTSLLAHTQKRRWRSKWLPWNVKPNRLFDETWYLTQYPDVALVGVDPLDHYRRMGVKEGRSPNPLFATAWYLEQNPDVAASGMNPLDHFLDHGAAEGRDPHPLFKISEYLDKHRTGETSVDLDRYWDMRRT